MQHGFLKVGTEDYIHRKPVAQHLLLRIDPMVGMEIHAR
jgi:hypothetical protein